MDQITNTEMTQPVKQTDRTVLLGLEYKVAATLCYLPLLLCNVIVPIALYVSEPGSNKKLRYHAIQGLGIALTGMVLGTVCFAATMMTLPLLAIPFVGFWLMRLVGGVSSIVSIGFIGLNLYAMYCAYSGKQLKLPYISKIAEDNA